MRFALILILSLSALFVNGQTQRKMDAIKEMTDWLESPMELNEKPKTISVRDNRKIFWPSQKVEQAYLIDFTDSKGDAYIGFTGPVTWTFFAIDFSKLTNEELYNLYTGWFICFSSYQQQSVDDPDIENDKRIMINKLKKLDYSDISIEMAIKMAGQIYFEITALKDQQSVSIVGTITDIQEYNQDVVLPLYKYIGEAWNPLEVE